MPRPSPSSARMQTIYPYFIVLTGIILNAVPVSLICSCAGIYFTPVSQYFHVPKAVFTGYFSLFSITMVFFLPIAGRLMSKFDLRAVLSASILLVGLGCLAMSRTTAIWQFYVCGFVMGVGMPAVLYLAVPTLINAWFCKRIGFNIGLCMAFTGIGGAVFNQLGNSIIQSAPDGWRRGYLTFGIIILVVTLPFTIFVVRSHPSDLGLQPYGADRSPINTQTDKAINKEEDKSAAKPTDKGITAHQALRTPAFWSLVIFCALITMNQTVYQFLPSYAASIPSMAAMAGLIASSCMVGQAIGKITLGFINDQNVLLGLGVGISSGLIGIFLMWAFPTHRILLLLGSFGFGFVYACTTVETPLLARSVFGTLDYTEIYARIQMAGSAASAVAAILWGIIIDRPHGYAILFTLSALIMVVALATGSLPLVHGRRKSRLYA